MRRRNLNLRETTSKAVQAMLGLLAGLLISELAVRVLFPTEDQTKYYAQVPNLKQIFKPDPATFPGIYGESRFSINSQGIRGDEFSPNQDYHILVIGGSTTECLYLDDTEAWPYVLQTKLNQSSGQHVWVGNVAKASLDSRHHIYHMQYLLPQYHNIDAVVILVGVNELWHFIVPAQVEYFGDDFERSRAFAFQPAPVADEPFYKKTALWLLLRRVKANGLRPAEPTGGFYQDVEGKVFVALRQRRQNATEYVNDLPDMTQALQDYARNLNTIVDLAQANSVRLILMTQPFLYKENMTPQEDALIWGGALENSGKIAPLPNEPNRYYTTGAMSRGMKQYNQTLLQVCQARGVECVDLASALPQDTTIFYSDVHFHENGARQVANVLAEYLVNHPPFKTPN